MVINGISSSIGPDYQTDFKLPNSETKQVFDLLQANSPNDAGTSGQIVMKVDDGYANDPAAQAEMKAIADFAAEQQGVTVVQPGPEPGHRSAQNGRSPSPR